MNFPLLNSSLSHVATLLIMSSVAYVGSLVTWQGFNQPSDTVSQIIIPSNLQNEVISNQGDLLTSYPLFGKAPVKSTQRKRAPKRRKRVTQVAPKVSFKLRGILAGRRSYAIIEIGREQEVYAVGDSLSYLYIEEIAEDYVIFGDDGIEHKIFVSDDLVSIGGGETSKYSGDDLPSQRTKTASTNNNAQTNRDANALPTFVASLSTEEKRTLQNVKKTLSKNPLQALGKVNAFPYRDQGKLVGYRVTPGSEKSLFSNVGLQPGDVILSANGYPLDEINNFTEGMRLMERLSQANILDLMINRRGVVRRVYISIE